MKQAILLFSALLLCPHAALAQKNNLDLKSQAAIVFNAHNARIIYDKNADKVMPIASITKLMTAMVTLDARLSPHERITISKEDVDTLKRTSSRLPVGSSYARHELLRLALMSSENRAAAALGRAYPGGINAFIKAMNHKAKQIGMTNSRFVDSTGLNSNNVATARDLAKLVTASNKYTVIREFSTTSKHIVSSSNKRGPLQYVNSNSLVRHQDWAINVSKTGYLSEAGRCLVMQANISGQPTVIVLLNSWGKNTRIGDANRVKKWIESNHKVADTSSRIKRI
ncbi:D-alanyl-D-alanine endopeptidase [Nitrosomonas sp. JL21]|uniref:D-alanyl-D-alanine endopeptidase n=1 Tax=Nitrosomonas sp. JL21 TaxID=153949 RepID=UPI0013722D44|nr:D-alanyl-D-alanine endopeptidase [Nitrosomonas sp. JL21]MBL8497904.1 D-alanyl-D-alanine endopeptidase [Nitrosomonas sp.]MCC7090767.1 D-alanyl-D-alanine endopeptidase [Nitrosomonas sp.]MXS78247.1 D-alanyl-D-alanine endopeptidase [Nitrosomonas sp. JL21]